LPYEMHCMWGYLLYSTRLPATLFSIYGRFYHPHLAYRLDMQQMLIFPAIAPFLRKALLWKHEEHRVVLSGRRVP
jgi:hypothetical protein